MPRPVFHPRIQYQNSQLIPPAMGVRAPQGLPAGAMLMPLFVSEEELMRRRTSQSGVGDGTLGTLGGLVEANFNLSFAGMRWEALSNGQVRFLEGSVYLELSLTIFVSQRYQPNGTGVALRQLFAEIMNHELEHMVDEINVVTDYLPHRLADHYATHNCFDSPLTTLSRDYHFLRGGYERLIHNCWLIERSQRALGRHQSPHHRARLRRMETLGRRLQYGR